MYLIQAQLEPSFFTRACQARLVAEALSAEASDELLVHGASLRAGGGGTGSPKLGTR